MTQFDALGKAYERSAYELPFREHIEKYSMHNAVAGIAGLDVLDLGCGSGLYTRRYSQWGADRVIGLDSSEGMLGVARDHAESAPNVQYVVGDATCSNVALNDALAEAFDLVASVYVLCYAATIEQLKGFFDTSRRAIKHSGGKVVAMTLNPDYSRATGYYQHYGFSVRQSDDDEGASVTLTAPTDGDEDFEVTAHWWSVETYEAAAHNSGFTNLAWTLPTVSSEGQALLGEKYWANYLRRPHGVILTADLPRSPN